MKIFLTITFLIVSNIFMTMAWYGHLKLNEWGKWGKLSIAAVILISWSIALFEYCFQVPANRIGYNGNGGPFSIWQLKVLQEVITLTVFSLFVIFVFKTETFRLNHLIGFSCLVAGVYFIFKP